MKQYYTGEFCPECIKKGLPCPVLYKSGRRKDKNKLMVLGSIASLPFKDKIPGDRFICLTCGFTAPLLGTEGRLF